jgi:hypothetical protein
MMHGQKNIKKILISYLVLAVYKLQFIPPANFVINIIIANCYWNVSFSHVFLSNWKKVLNWIFKK